MRQNNEALLNSQFIAENRQRLADKEANKNKKYIEETNSFVKTYNKIRDKRVLNEREHGKLVEETRNNVFCDILKAIYITALEAEALTDNGLLLAESMVDNYVKDRGGALKILNPVKNNTYLLAKIANILEDTTEAEVAEIEDIKEEPDAAPATSEEDEAELIKKVIELGYTVSKDTAPEPEKAEEPTATEEVPAEEPAADASADTEIVDDEEDDDMDLASGNVETEAPEEPAGEEEPKEEEPAEAPEEEKEEAPSTDVSEGPDTEVKDAEPAEGEEAPESAEEEPATEEPAEEAEPEESEESGEDNDEKDSEENEEPSQEELDAETPDGEFNDEDEDGEDDLDIDGDGEDDFGVDEPDDTVNVDPKKTMFQELEKEKEVKDAIELIRTRVADAEQAFINRNAADKEKINSLLAKISDNIKTVEKISDNDSDESKVAQESANIAKRRINEITNNRPLTVFECLARNITANIIKNESVKENYITESGQLDTPVVVEAVKVMYGFLETLNTLQLESVDSDYILSIVKEFK